jgi:biopolymer transport protein ExbD/biopolymer transport protein TolR
MAMNPASERGGLLSAINVTPMADVMIVLIIIFMVAASLVRDGHVKAPPPAEHANDQAEATVVELAADGAVYLDGVRLADSDDLLLRLSGRPLASAEIQVRADESLPYGAVARLLELGHGAGAEQFVLVTRRRLAH